MTRRPLFTALILATMATAAEAHSGHAAGLLHPFTGLDHIAAMVAVGLFAAQLGGRALWLVPGSFMAMMALGAAAGVAGLSIPFVEAGIILSVVILGAAALLRWTVPVSFAMMLAGFFAVFHGQAHGAEMPADASALTYAAGFLLATAILHGAGAGLGFLRVKAGTRADAGAR